MGQAQQPPLKVAVAATPPLLADTLRTLLAQHGVAATLLTTPTPERFDVAVIDGSEVSVSAELVITLAHSPDGRTSGTVTDRTGEVILELDGLAAIVDVLRSVSD